jgi:hypothetical protein
MSQFSNKISDTAIASRNNFVGKSTRRAELNSFVLIKVIVCNEKTKSH